MVTVTPVRQELEPWLGSVASHVAGQALLNEEALVRFLGLDGDYKREQASTEYHVNLLGFSKRLVTVEVATFQGEARASSEG